GDANGRAYGGGGVDVGAVVTDLTVSPTVSSYIDSGTSVHAGGNVTVHAHRVPLPPLPPPFIIGVDPVADTITFPQHGLSTGDVVTYAPDGNTPIKTDDSSQAQNLQSGIKLPADPTKPPTLGGDPRDPNSGTTFREYPVL